MVYLLEYVYAKFDGLVKCRNDIVFVIPAFAGVTGFKTFHEAINFGFIGRVYGTHDHPVKVSTKPGLWGPGPASALIRRICISYRRSEASFWGKWFIFCIILKETKKDVSSFYDPLRSHE